MAMIRFGTDGIRGRVGDVITEEVAYAVGRAAAETIASGRLLVARDTRQSGDVLARAFDAGGRDGGAEVVHLGVVPTPVLAHATVVETTPGCMITASHNPYHDNGLKLFGPEGLKLSPQQETAVESRVNGLLADGAGPEQGTDVPPAVFAGPVDGYTAALLDHHRDLDLSGLAVGFDFANGAGSFLGPRLFDQFKLARVLYIGAEPDGVNINDGFGSTAPEAIMAAVVEGGLDAGFAFDGDGDRVMAVDNTGRLVDGDQLMAILAADMAERGVLAARSIVVSNWSNLGLFKAMEARNIEVVQSQVGDKYILELLTAAACRWAVSNRVISSFVIGQPPVTACSWPRRYWPSWVGPDAPSANSRMRRCSGGPRWPTQSVCLRPRPTSWRRSAPYSRRSRRAWGPTGGLCSAPAAPNLWFG